MRKNPMLNRIMSLGLALALFVSSPASVYAVDASESASAETIVEETSEEAVDTAEGESASNDDTATSRENESDDSKNQDQASDESKSDEKDSKSEEKVNKEETEKTSDEKASEEQTDKNKEEKAKEEKELTEKESEEETSYSYKSNGDGTHIKSWTDEDGEAHEETEKCEFDEDGKCKFCEYEKEEEVKEDKTFTVEVDGYKITAVVPADAFDTEVEFFAKTCELSEEEEEAVAEVTITKELGGYTAFDIYFEADGEEVEPEGSVKISIESDSVEETNEIVHLKDETTAEVVEADVTDSVAEFEADSFSKYVITETDAKKILYQNTSYGALVSNTEHKDSGDYRLRVYYTNSNNNSDKKIGPVDAERYYFDQQNIKLTFYAPENYYVAATAIGNKNEGNIKYYNEKPSEVTIEVPLNAPTGNNNNKEYHDTNVYVNFQLKKSTFDSDADTSMVNGATLVKYVNKITAADNFKFSEGGTGGNTGSGTSNVCNYGQVYQGLADDSIEDGFQLTGNNAKDMFPADYAQNASSYNSYIKKLYSDVSVEFKKDTDGYWTLDSGVYSYKYSNGKIAPTGSGNGFFPLDGYNGFDTTHDHVHHFGMEIPINFNVNSNGKVDANASRDDKEAEDTVFRFSGDDDVFVYIDNQLVLDLGGVHSAVQGQINFNTGEILIQGHNGGSGGSSGDSALVSSYDGKVFAHQTNSVDTTLWDLLDTNLETFSQQNHLMRVVYFERGDYDSNCRISYNFNPNTTTTANFEGMKIDSSKKTGLAGAQFKLYTDPECQKAAGTYTATSLDDGTIKFTGLAEGTYYMKEVKAPSNYNITVGAVWKLVVAKKDSLGNLGCKLYAYNEAAKSSSLGEKKAELKNDNTEVKFITNSPNVLEVDKTASVTDYNKRVYKLDLTADYTGTEYVETEQTTEVNADVVMVLDTSGSMTFTDAPIISVDAYDDAAAYKLLSVLDKSKIYFTSAQSEYGEGYELYSSAKSYVLPESFHDGKCYGIPTSGYYIFYDKSTNAWYIQGMQYEETTGRGRNKKTKTYNYLETNRWNNTSYATRLSSNNCPTTIYTNRSEVILNAANTFVDGLTNGSSVAIVTFGNEDAAKVKCQMTSISTGKSTITNAINSAYGKYGTATYPSYGLTKAEGILKNDTSENNKYVVFFTDGMIDDNDSVKDVSTSLHSLEHVTVYAIGAGADGGTLETVATSTNHIISGSAVTEVAKSLSGLSTTIINESRPKTGKGKVTDYIDSRFVASDANGNPLSNGAKVGKNGEGTLIIDADGAQRVEWEDVSIGTGDSKWSDYIYVKAKDTFFGGNKVVTNGPGSNVSITGDQTKNFPQPTVNVKLLDFVPNNNEITLWLGDTIEGTAYVKWLADNTAIPEDALTQIAMTDEEKASLIAGNTITKDYNAGGEKLGEFKFNISAVDNTNTAIEVINHTAEKTGNAVETYTLTIKYDPIPVSQRTVTDSGRAIKPPVGTEVTSVTKTGNYIVNVITGSLNVLKHSTDINGALLDGAEYQLDYFKDDSKYVKVSTLTSGAANPDGTAANGLMAFNNLGVGLYRLTETKAPEGFAKSGDVYFINIRRNPEETTKVQYTVSISKNSDIIGSWKIDSEVTRDEDDKNICTCVMENGVVKAGLDVVDPIAYTLPETGGSGVYVYTIGGILLMIAGALLLYKNKNNKNK